MISNLFIVVALSLVLDEMSMTSAIPVTTPRQLIKRKEMEYDDLPVNYL